MNKIIKAHEEKKANVKAEEVKDGAMPAYLLDREKTNPTKILSNSIK